MTIVILGYSGEIGNDILKSLADNFSINLICVGKNIKNKPKKNSNIKYIKWDFKTFKKKKLTFLKKTNIIINCVGKTDNNAEGIEYINFIFVKKLIEYINLNKFKLRLIHLSSVSIYGGPKNFFGTKKLISENSTTLTYDNYSKSKLKADLIIQNVVKENLNKNFSFTILRISNVFGGRQQSNLFKFVLFSLKSCIWVKSYEDIIFNFVNIKDVTQSVILIITKIKISKNKTYIVSDDCKQYELYKKYQKTLKKKILKIPLPFKLLKFINFFPLPKKIFNLIYLISSRVTYSNVKIKNELNYKPKFSIQEKIQLLNE